MILLDVALATSLSFVSVHIFGVLITWPHQALILLGALGARAPPGVQGGAKKGKGKKRRRKKKKKKEKKEKKEKERKKKRKKRRG